MEKLHIMITPKETKLVKRIASKMYENDLMVREKRNVSREDLYHWGIIGLCEAKQDFDASTKVPLEAWEAIKIKWEIFDKIRKLPMIRLPQERQERVKELKAARDELERMGAPSDPETLAERLRWTVENVHQVQALTPSVTTAAEDQGEDDGPFRGEILADHSSNPEDLTKKKQIKEAVQRCLEGLSSATDRLVLVGRIWEDLKLRELAETLGCSLENVRLVQKRAEVLMRDCLERQGWG